MQNKPDPTFVRFLSIILRHGKMYFDMKLDPFHIRAGQIPILRFLEVKDGVSQETIRKYFRLDKGTITKAIKPLLKEGYITRKTNPEDKRAYQLFLTDKGRSILPDIKIIVKKWTDVLTADFTGEEKETALRLLSRMSQNAHGYLASCRSENSELER
jgi:DNA-binding MarR family transcriptional regulator